MASMTPLPRRRCQNVGCKYRARFFVAGSEGWQGHHCGVHAREVVQHQLFQVAKGAGIVILPYCEEALMELSRMAING